MQTPIVRGKPACGNGRKGVVHRLKPIRTGNDQPDRARYGEQRVNDKRPSGMGTGASNEIIIVVFIVIEALVSQARLYHHRDGKNANAQSADPLHPRSGE